MLGRTFQVSVPYDPRGGEILCGSMGKQSLSGIRQLYHIFSATGRRYGDTAGYFQWLRYGIFGEKHPMAAIGTVLTQCLYEDLPQEFLALFQGARSTLTAIHSLRRKGENLELQCGRRVFTD